MYVDIVMSDSDYRHSQALIFLLAGKISFGVMVVIIMVIHVLYYTYDRHEFMHDLINSFPDLLNCICAYVTLL